MYVQPKTKFSPQNKDEQQQNVEQLGTPTSDEDGNITSIRVGNVLFTFSLIISMKLFYLFGIFEQHINKLSQLVNGHAKKLKNFE